MRTETDEAGETNYYCRCNDQWSDPNNAQACERLCDQITGWARREVAKEKARTSVPVEGR